VTVDEPLGVLRQRVVRVEGLVQNLVGDVLGNVARPALGGVEGDDAESVPVLPGEEVADYGLAVRLRRVGLSISAAVLAEVFLD
jgi:hypothetical protein